MNITEPGNKVKDPGLKLLAEASAFTLQIQTTCVAC
jgi:hypothetical protein